VGCQLAPHPLLLVFMRDFLLLFLLAATVACASETSSLSSTAPAEVLVPPTTVIAPTTTTSTPTSSPSPLAELTKPLESAIYDPTRLFDESINPVGLRIGGIDVDSPVVPVGVLDNGEMEIPGAAEVGWYRYGPSPGESGSAVLAAHIAYNGRNGVFRQLDRMQVGDTFEVVYDDGSVSKFVVAELAQYSKTELPFDRVFAKEGDAELVLITCGGTFNESLRSYDDNFVVYAMPSAQESVE